MEIGRLEKESARRDFWLDQGKAQDTMRQLAEHKKVVEQWRELEKRVVDLAELVHLTGEDEPNGTYADSPTSISPVGIELKELRSRSPSLREFLDTVIGMTSREELAESLQR